MSESTGKKYSFHKLLFVGLFATGIKALLFAFAMSFVGKVLYSVLHEAFLPLIKRIIVSPELYEDMLTYLVIFIIFSLPGLYLSTLDNYESDKNNA